MNRDIICIGVLLMLVLAVIPSSETMENFQEEKNRYIQTFKPLAKQTIYINTSAIDARTDLNATQKTALKNHIIQHVRENFEGAVGSANVTISNDPKDEKNASRIVKIEPGRDPNGRAWGRTFGENKTVKVFLGEFMDDSSVNGSFQNPDGSWNITKLGNALGHTGGHEAGHTFSVGHNHETRPAKDTDNRSKMTAGGNLNTTERARARYRFDNHSKDVIKKNWGKPPCSSFPDYDDKVVSSHFYGPPSIPDKPDEWGSLDVIFAYYSEIPGWFELGFLGVDTDNGEFDGNPEFDFVYKTSLLDNPDIDADILTFIEDFHEHTTWLLRGSEISPFPGEWFMVTPDNVLLSDLIDTPDGKTVARFVEMMWPDHGVFVTFDALSYGYSSNPYNGFTYDFVPTPPVISGPDSGEPGIDYEYMFRSTIVTGDDLFYYVDWGDGIFDEWFGPFPPDVDVPMVHVWDEPGLYTIGAKSKSMFEAESSWSYFTVAIDEDMPELDIEITGGIGVSAVITNSGEVDAINVAWEINVEGGFVLFGGNEQGSSDIPVGGEINIGTMPIGIGAISITVTADPENGDAVTKTEDGFLLLIFVIMN